MRVVSPRRLSILFLTLLSAAAPHLQADEAPRWGLGAGLEAWTAAPWGPVPLSLPASGGLRYPPWPKAYALISPEFALPADPFQQMTVTYSAPAGAVIGVSWIGRKAAGDIVGAFVPLPKTRDDAPGTITVQPHWQDFTLIKYLQILVPPNTPLIVGSVSLSDPRRTMPLSHRTIWDNEEGFKEWRPLAGIRSVKWTPTGLAVALSEATGTLISPPLNAPAAEMNWLGATVMGSAGARLSLRWACDGAAGLRGEEFTLPDSAPHAVNTRLFGETGWRGDLKGLAVQITGRPAGAVTIQRIELANLPTGGPDLRTLYFGLLDPTPAVGQPQTLVWVGENQGGKTVRNLIVRPTEPAGLPPKAIARLDFGLPTELRWDLGACKPGVLVLGAEIRGDGLPAATQQATPMVFVQRPAGAPPAPTTALPPFDPPITRWAFTSPADKAPWSVAMGFRSLEVADGALRGTTVTAEPALFGGETRLDAREFDTIRLRLSASAGRRARLWWATNMQPLAPENSIPFALQPDGRTHEYILRPGPMPGWRGLITGFRLDPSDTTGAQIALEEVRVTHELN